MSADLGQTVRVAVYEADGTTLITHVPRRRNVQWLNEVNSPGTAQFELPLDDAVLINNPTMLTYFNVVKFFIGDTPVKAWLIESIQPVQAAQGEGADRWITVSGRGPLSCLEAAIVYPDYMMSNILLTKRSFNFAGRANENWFVTGNWVAPAYEMWPGAYRKMPDRTPGGAKFKWPDPITYYLWYPFNAGNDDGALRIMPSGTVYFRSTFTLSTSFPVDLVIYATADDKLNGLYFDGQFLTASTGKSAWKTVWSAKVYNVQPGEHVISAECENVGKDPTPAGYIMACYQLDGDGNRIDDAEVTFSNPVETICTTDSDLAGLPTPGWRPALVLKQLIQEAQGTESNFDDSPQSTRQVDCLLPFKMDSFTIDHDSAGIPWDEDDLFTTKVPVATTDLYDIAQQMIEISCDIDVDSDFNLHAWKERGTDKSATVRLIPAYNVTAFTAQGQAQRVRTRTIVMYNGGIVGLYASSSEDAYGRREVGISAGSATNEKSAIRIGKAALREVTTPEVSATTTITNMRGPQPFQDFDLGDTISIPSGISVPGVFTTMTTGRVMSIAASEASETVLNFDITYYPTVDDPNIDQATIQVADTGGSRTDRYSQAVLDDSPWGYWRLNESGGSGATFSNGDTFKDSVKPGHLMYVTVRSGDKPVGQKTGAIAAAVEFGNTSVSGQQPAGSFAITSPVDIDHPRLLKTQYCTLECWVNLFAIPSTEPTDIMSIEDGHGQSMTLRVGTAGHVIFKIHNDDHDNVVTSAATLTADGNHWYYIAGSYGANGQRVYVNGSLDAHDSNPPNFPAPGGGGYTATLRGSLFVLQEPVKLQLAEPAIYGQEIRKSQFAVKYNILLGE